MPRQTRRFRLVQSVVAHGGALALAASAALSAQAAPLSLVQLQALESALKDGGTALSGLLESGAGLDPTLIELRRKALLRQFPDASWSLSPGPTLRDGRSTVELQVKGSHQQGGKTFRLEARQLLALASSKGRLTAQTLLREQTILRSGEIDLPISLQIPDAVLTGQRYDVDVVVDEPLAGAVLAGGLVALTASQVRAMEMPRLELGALGGGGLFKTVQAPYSPGEQTWAVLLVHPKGIVTATKRVRVVSDRSQLTP